MQREEYSAMSQEIATLMAKKLGARGRDLKAKLRHSGRLMPRPVKEAANVVAEAEKHAGNPKLLRRIDPVAVGHAKHVCVTHLRSIDTAAARRRAIADFFSGLALNILLLAVLILAILVWRGFL